MLLHGRTIGNQKGQAITEYVLLLFISLTIIGGIIYQFNTAFKVYLDAWFLDPEESYLACIIKNGVLPDGGDQTADCTLPRFDMKDGRPKTQNANGPGSSPDKLNSSLPNGAGGSSRSGSGGNRSGDGRARGGIPYNSADAKNAGLSSATAKKDAKANTGDNSFSSSRSGGSSGSEGGSSSQETIAFSGGRKGRMPSENLDEKAASTVPLNDRDIKSAREIAAEKTKKKQATAEKEFDLTFGNVFKYLIIAFLIFALIFFVGSQFLAVSRSKKRK